MTKGTTKCLIWLVKQHQTLKSSKEKLFLWKKPLAHVNLRGMCKVWEVRVISWCRSYKYPTNFTQFELRKWLCPNFPTSLRKAKINCHGQSHKLSNLQDLSCLRRIISKLLKLSTPKTTHKRPILFRLSNYKMVRMRWNAAVEPAYLTVIILNYSGFCPLYWVSPSLELQRP